MAMIKRDRQPLLGCTIIETQVVSREPVTCECCGKVMAWKQIVMPPEPDSFRMDDDASFEVRIFHWGDDNTDTTRVDFRLCPTCFKEDALFVPFVLSKGFSLHAEGATQYNRFLRSTAWNPVAAPIVTDK